LREKRGGGGALWVWFPPLFGVVTNVFSWLYVDESGAVHM